MSTTTSMTHPNRRKADRVQIAGILEDNDPTRARLEEQGWIEHCIELILLCEPSMVRAEAMKVADEMRHFERTGAMGPNEAVMFVVSEFDRGLPSRLERRRLVRQASGNYS